MTGSLDDGNLANKGVLPRGNGFDSSEILEVFNDCVAETGQCACCNSGRVVPSTTFEAGVIHLSYRNSGRCK